MWGHRKGGPQGTELETSLPFSSLSDEYIVSKWVWHLALVRADPKACAFPSCAGSLSKEEMTRHLMHGRWERSRPTVSFFVCQGCWKLL